MDHFLLSYAMDHLFDVAIFTMTSTLLNHKAEAALRMEQKRCCVNNGPKTLHKMFFKCLEGCKHLRSMIGS